MKNVISIILAWLWGIWVLPGMILSPICLILMIIFNNIFGMIKSGYATTTVGLECVFVMGIMFSITGLVPAFRRCYIKLPWLYPLNVLLLCNLFIVSIAEEIIAKGYERVITSRHIVAIVIMLVQIIVCRVAMSIYFKKYPFFVKSKEVQNGKD